MLCSTTRLLLYNSISECVSAETEAVSGEQSCYVAELHTKFDPGNRLTNPWRYLRSLSLSEGICLGFTTPNWAGMKEIPREFLYSALNPSYLCPGLANMCTDKIVRAINESIAVIISHPSTVYYHTQSAITREIIWTMIKEYWMRNCGILWLWSICAIEDCVNHHAWHSFKSLTWIWHSIIGLCCDVSVSRQELELAKALAACSVLSLSHCCECLYIWALNILSRFDLQDCMCIMQT